MFRYSSLIQYLCVILLLTIPALMPLFHYGLPPTHDGEYHVIRFYEFFTTFTQGELYPRWAMHLNNGYGVPLFNYVYPLPNYVSLGLHFLGLSFIDSFKANLIIATLISGVFMYLWSRKFCSELGAFVSSILYIYAPYRFVDIYVRGSVGEVWALALGPAVFWAFTELIQKKSYKYIVISVILLSLLIFSHNIIALIYLVFLLSYISYLFLENKEKKSVFKVFIITLFLGLCLSAIFWLPALFEKKYVRGLDIYNINDNFPELYQLILPSWGTGFSNGELNNQMSFQIGITHIFVVFLALGQLFFVFKNKRKQSSILLFLLGAFFITVFFLLSYSSPLWFIIPFLSYFQFPWRLLSLIIIITSLLGGYVISIFKSRKKQAMLAAFLIILEILLTFSYTKPAYYLERKDDYYLNRPNFIDGTNSPGNYFNTIWMNPSIAKTESGLWFVEKRGTIKQLVYNSTYRKYNITSHDDSLLQANIAFFPGWTVFEDGKQIRSYPDKNGILKFSINKGNHIIEIIFLDTIIRGLAKWISLLAVISIVVYPIYKYKKHENCY